MPTPDNPAALAEYDPGWPGRAARALAAIEARLQDLPVVSEARFDHIGSTSVPDLAAKPVIDLQVSLLPLPEDDELIARLGPLGYRRATGSRPDSPGVYRDLPRGAGVADDEVWTKSLFVNEDATVILHIRRADSPWAHYTVWFRDWLRAHPTRRHEYETIKRELSAQNAGKPDYDDYTRAKTAFFDQIQDQFEHWAALSNRHPAPLERRGG
jgi:dephospho-CoA kinase